MIFGELKAVHRYPIKSFGGEALSEAAVAAYGLYGDRSHAIIDASKEGWDRFVTARDIPSMLQYRASMGPGSGNEVFPSLKITDPEGGLVHWDASLLEQLQPHYKGKLPLSLETQNPASIELLAVDTASVLIVTESSLNELERRWGKVLDPARFRPNLTLSLLKDVAFAEEQWVGRLLRIGSAVFKVDEPCERCMMVTLDPVTAERNPSLLTLLQRETSVMFGMYASVAQPGTIQVGDKVQWV